MFRITTKTCREFTCAEILLLAAMNLETVRLDFKGRILPNTSTERDN
jgi:hypothetical protein